MFLEEKIDRLKRETDPKDFRVPYTDGSRILKNIDTKFIIKENFNHGFSNWDDRVKDKRKVKAFRKVDINIEFAKLNPDENYWIVIPSDNPTTKNLIYDSKPNFILKLLELRHGDFFIVNKKYDWLTYFKSDQVDIEVFKSGDKQTPWDRK